MRRACTQRWKTSAQRPAGITDYASIVFSDEGDILKDRTDPDIAHSSIHKGQLGLFYIERSSLALDLKLIALTAVAIASRPRALRGVVRDCSSAAERYCTRSECKRVSDRSQCIS